MRTTPYPDPPSRTWAVAALATYAALALAGGIVLLVLATSPQPPEGVLVLGLWGGLSLVSSLACVWGVAQTEYRWEWFGCWGIVAGTSVYLVVTVLGIVGLPVLLLLILTLATAIGFLWAAAGSRHWYLWIGAGVIASAGLITVISNAMGDGFAVLLTSAPTLLVFLYAVGITLGRAIHLSLLDMQARRHVIATRTGEIPEVPANG